MEGGVKVSREGGLAPIPWVGRAILLVDLDAFFASVEQLDNPQWRGKPVIVGGDPDKRGVVATASYEARVYGVHSAMPSATARKLCPDAIWTRGRHSRYKEVSDAVMEVLNAETPFMQQVSIDEAFLDVTPTEFRGEHPLEVAMRIKRRVREIGVTCSIGLGVSKSVAKIASDMDKPDGLTVVYPGSEAEYLSPLPLSSMSGIGKSANDKLMAFGLRTLGDVAAADHSILASVFGKNAEMMRLRCLGADSSPVEQDDGMKSVSAEMSFATSLADRRSIQRAIATMAAKVCRRLRKKGLKAGTITLKIRYENLKARTAQIALDQATDDEYLMAERLESALDGLWSPGMPVRLVGVSTSRFGMEAGDAVQETLFGPDEDESAAVLSSKRDKRRNLMAVTDLIRDRFGERAVNYGRENATLDGGTGTASKNPGDYRK